MKAILTVLLGVSLLGCRSLHQAGPTVAEYRLVSDVTICVMDASDIQKRYPGQSSVSFEQANTIWVAAAPMRKDRNGRRIPDLQELGKQVWRLPEFGGAGAGARLKEAPDAIPGADIDTMTQDFDVYLLEEKYISLKFPGKGGVCFTDGAVWAPYAVSSADVKTVAAAPESSIFGEETWHHSELGGHFYH
jgi:hypothetical protein